MSAARIDRLLDLLGVLHPKDPRETYRQLLAARGRLSGNIAGDRRQMRAWAAKLGITVIEKRRETAP